MKYRKKSITVEAYKTGKELIIHTLEGDMKANVGDYIITGVNGEQYPCKPDIFEKTYEKVDETAKQPTADVQEVRHGRWIKRGNEKKCSVCEFIYYSNNDMWSFCPNCGADMRGDKNDV